MEEAYAEATAKIKVTLKTIAMKIGSVLFVVLLFIGMYMLQNTIFSFFVFIPLAAAVFLFWYWPRFKEEWEYIYCDGQLDFDIIQGGERRKHKLRIEIENADVVAPIKSNALDGYRHISVLDYSSLYEKDNIYGIAVRLPDKEEKVLIKFEPDEKMINMMHAKYPNIVKLS